MGVLVGLWSDIRGFTEPWRKGIGESAEGWRMFFGGGSAVLDGVSGAQIKPGYMVSGKQGRGMATIPIETPTVEDPGTPATVVAAIQKSIGESAEGWRIGFASIGQKLSGASAKAQAGVEKSLAGWGMGISHAASKTGDAFGNIGGGLSSFKYPLYALVAVFLFIAVMVSVGYSGLGGPAARVAEKEYVKRR